MSVTRASHSVAVRVGRGSAYTDEVLRGIAAFGSTRAAWRYEGSPTDRRDHDAARLKRCDGLLVYEPRWRVLEAYETHGVPVVNTTSRNLPRPVARVCPENQAIGEAGAAALLDLGLTAFVLLVRERITSDAARAGAFERAVARRGRQTIRVAGADKFDENAIADVTETVRRLAADRPLGLMAATDAMAVKLVKALTAAGVDVPGRVAVLGCGNDELTCTFSDPDISSIDTDGFHIGYRAAELLQDLMTGEQTGTPRIDVRPAGVIHRGSTDMLGIEDPAIADAIRFIRRHACKGIRVTDVLPAAPVTRKALERGVKRAIGRSPLQEIRRVQLDTARRLLTETELSVEQVAQRIGLRDGRYLSQVFRKAEGVTPTAYRTEHRRPS